MGCTPSLLPERDARGPLRIYARSRGTGTYIDRLVARLGWCFVHHGRGIASSLVQIDVHCAAVVQVQWRVRDAACFH
jgi:hypothetical protein